MFRRRDHDLPQGAHFDHDLAKLGLTVTKDLEFVNITNGKHFEYYITDSDRYNEVRKEAVHTAARERMVAELVAEGMQEVYLCGDGTEVHAQKPDAPHVKILTTRLEELRGKTDVIVLVGEHNQDMGVFAYRSFMRHDGMKGASAVGLLKKCKAAFEEKEVVGNICSNITNLQVKIEEEKVTLPLSNHFRTSHDMSTDR